MSNTQPSLRVQLVLYRNDVNELDRAFESAINALAHASAAVSRWVVVFGDCSPEPVCDQSEVEHLSLLAEQAGGTFHYEFFDENLGHGGGHNRLHASSDEDLLLILNPDGILAPDAIARLLEAMTPDTGVIDARQLPLEHPKEYDAVSGNASWSSLACALTPSRVFLDVGGLDHDTFFMYCDDVDYSWRVRLHGLRARYCPQARMFHDKRLDRDGIFMAGETEHYYSAEAALMLAHKYSRNDIVQQLEQTMDGSESVYHRRAVAEFRKRRASGNLPAQLDEDHRVAEFVGGTYGAHRF